jgi:MFS transporter, DHA2 family, multidrug resistance protein
LTASATALPAGGARPSSGPPQAPPFSPPIPTAAVWLGFVTMIFGNFMAILDIQIVSSAIAQIQAGVSASPSEIAWVQSAYLIAEVIAIPLSGYLGRALGVRNLYILSAGGFTIASVLCAIAWDLDSLIIFRALQGFLGGAMIPTTMAAIYIFFPRSHQILPGVLVGLVSTLAPSIGPTLGGFIADTMGWRWLFLINIVPGIACVLGVFLLVKAPKGDASLFRRIDMIGLLGLAVFLGSLEFVLHEGAGEGWFDSSEIWFFSILCAAGAVVFFWRALYGANPIVRIDIMGDKNFALGCLLTFIVGAGLYGGTYLQPVFFAQVQGFSATQIGQHMFAQGIAMFLAAPVVGPLARKVTDPRPLVAFGFVAVGVSFLMQSQLTAETGFWAFVWPQALRGFGLMFCFIPTMVLAMSRLPQTRVQDASGVYSLMRNLGGALGLAIIGTAQINRSAFHTQQIAAGMSPNRPEVQGMLDNLTAMMAARGVANPEVAARLQLGMLVQREGAVMMFNDIFLMVGIAFLVAAVGVVFLDKPLPQTGDAPAAH